jgi:hypothetical protein
VNARSIALAALLVCSACHRKGTLAGADAEPDPAAPKLVVATPDASVASESPGDAAPPPAGPAASGAAGSEERRRVLASLLSGTTDARALPEVGTDPGAAFDRGLRRRMTTVQVPNEDPLGGPRAASVVTIGASTTTVEIANRERIIAGLRPRFRACYETGLMTDPAMSGKMVLTATVDKSGDVSSAKATSNSGISTAVADCIVGVLRRVTFDPPASPATLTLPLRFGPGL